MYIWYFSKDCTLCKQRYAVVVVLFVVTRIRLTYFVGQVIIPDEHIHVIPLPEKITRVHKKTVCYTNVHTCIFALAVPFLISICG